MGGGGGGNGPLGQITQQRRSTYIENLMKKKIDEQDES